MTLKLRHLGVLIGAFILIGAGLYIFTQIGIPIFNQVNNSKQHPKCSVEVRCSYYPVNLSLIHATSTTQIHSLNYTANGTPVVTQPNLVLLFALKGNFTFASNETFAVGNPINYQLDLELNDPTNYVKAIYFIPAKENETFNLQGSTDQVLAEFQGQQRLIEMQRLSSTHLFSQGVVYPDIETSYTLIGIVEDQNGSRHIMPKPSVPLFTAVSYNEYQKALDNRQAKYSSDTVLALTWMGVGLAPALLGLDFVVRVVLRD